MFECGHGGEYVVGDMDSTVEAARSQEGVRFANVRNEQSITRTFCVLAIAPVVHPCPPGRGQVFAQPERNVHHHPFGSWKAKVFAGREDEGLRVQGHIFAIGDF